MQAKVFLRGVITTVIVALILFWGVGFMANADPVWFLRTFHPGVSAIRLYWEDGMYTLNPGDAGFDELTSAFVDTRAVLFCPKRICLIIANVGALCKSITRHLFRCTAVTVSPNQGCFWFLLTAPTHIIAAFLACQMTWNGRLARSISTKIDFL